MTHRDDDHISAVREAQQRYLEVLELQAATFGTLNTPPHILTQINDLRKVLADGQSGDDEESTVAVGPISRQEFDQLVRRVDRVVSAQLLSALSMVVSSITFILLLLVLWSVMSR